MKKYMSSDSIHLLEEIAFKKDNLLLTHPFNEKELEKWIEKKMFKYFYYKKQSENTILFFYYIN